MSDTDLATDPDRLRRLAATAVGDDRLWTAAPRWRTTTGRAPAGDDLLVWSDVGVVTLVPVARAVAELLDGAVTLGELADDLVAVAGLARPDARSLVATLVVELTALAAIDGVPAELAAVAPAVPVDRTGGARRERSAAELLPLDSCLGSQLRNEPDVPLVSVRGSDGLVRSVRCHAPEVEARLRARAGDRATDDERGPIEAFVVTPHAGCGPVRIFDGQGRRRGRPRDADQAAAVVDHVLGERATADREAAELGAGPASGPVLTGMVLVAAPDGRAVLVREEALEGVGLVRRLTVAGFTVTGARAVVDGTGCVAAPRGLGTEEAPTAAVEVVVPGAGALGLADRVRTLLGPVAPVTGPGRTDVLVRLLALAGRARWSTLDAPLDEVLGVEGRGDV